MPDYNNGKIYRIVCDITGETYYGSTTYKYLSSRLAKHRSTTTCKSKQIIERGNYSIVLVEEYPCENKEQLNKRERYYIENNECVNKYIPTRTKSEYGKEWSLVNRDYLTQKQRERRAKKK